MSKAERRKRARQRARERERATESAPVLSSGGVANLSVAAAFAEPEPAVHQEVVPTESDFITGPVVPRVPAPVRTVRPEAAASRLVATPVEIAAARTEDGVGDVESEDDDRDDEDEDEDEQGEDGEDGEDGEGAEDEELDEQDALFNLACDAVEQGDNLTWADVVTWLLAADVEDPRLALLASVVAPDDESSTDLPKLTGKRVLDKLALIGLEDIVTEARDTVAAAPKGEGESEEERALVRTTARELQAQAKRELSSDGSRPVRSSDVRAAKAGRVAR